MMTAPTPSEPLHQEVHASARHARHCGLTESQAAGPEVTESSPFAGLEALVVYVCTADLEDELIRAAGHAAVEQIIQAQGELRSFRTFQKRA